MEETKELKKKVKVLTQKLAEMEKKLERIAVSEKYFTELATIAEEGNNEKLASNFVKYMDYLVSGGRGKKRFSVKKKEGMDFISQRLKSRKKKKHLEIV
jgi:hypothetical protein